VLVDNVKSLITKHHTLTREIQFNEHFTAFANYWKFYPKACAPYRARTKNKDERATGIG
jgi:transposase